MLAVAVCLSGLACSSSPTPSSGVDRVRIPRIEFVPESETFAAAVGEYERIWAADAARIARTMQEVSGLTFTDTAITAVVFEGVSSSGVGDTPMRLRASYPVDTKRATLIHELGHRLQSPLFRRTDEEHGPLFLWLYDRSEEHTSELQSRLHLVCRLLLEKKKNKKQPTHVRTYP